MMLFLTNKNNLTTFLPGLGMCLMLLASCGPGDSSTTTTSTTSTTATGTTVQVSATATDSDNDQLHYRWAATEGKIANVDAPSTTWVVPPGSGLQFAYVLVSDNKGGYIESRAAVLTQGQVGATPAEAITTPVPTGGPGFVWGTLYFKGTFLRNVYLPGVTVQLTGPGGRYTATTDMKGEFFISGLQLGTPYTLSYTIPGRTPQTPQDFTTPASVTLTRDLTNGQTVNTPTMSPSSPSYIRQEVDLGTSLIVAGSVRLLDESYCGIRDEFFTLQVPDPTRPNLLSGPVSATAQLLTANNGPLSSLFPVNHYGDYLIVRSALGSPTDVKVRIQCEQGNAKDSAPFTVQPSGPRKEPNGITLDNSRPTINSMTVMLNGQDVGRPDLPKATKLLPEMDLAPGDDAFLTFKGIDTRKSACAYYRAIGAIKTCDDNGFPSDVQLTLDQWRSKFNLSSFSNGNLNNLPAPGTQEVKIIYINKTDLNFVREVQGVQRSDGAIAQNTCNYPGPQNTTGLGEPIPIGTDLNGGPNIQPNIDLAIENARRGIGMLACVAMEYSKTTGINNNQPFTKFYTFSPSGKLLLSLSLDGRREKFMPGSCTACHGGDFHGGRYPEDGSGRPDIGSRWQPFDMANLLFSTGQDMAVANHAIHKLNTMMIDDTTLASIASITKKRTKDLIAGWYKLSGDIQNSDSMPNTLPYTGYTLPFYRNVIQGSCQTCHAAQFTDEFISPTHICGGDADLTLNHTMTNALVTFERFWLNSDIQNDATITAQIGCSNKPLPHRGL